MKWGHHGNVHRLWTRVSRKERVMRSTAYEHRETHTLPRFGPSIGGKNLLLLVWSWLMVEDYKVPWWLWWFRCDLAYDILHQVAREPPLDPSWPLYRRPGLGYPYSGGYRWRRYAPEANNKVCFYCHISFVHNILYYAKIVLSGNFSTHMAYNKQVPSSLYLTSSLVN
jgi:hypothetical protein